MTAKGNRYLLGLDAGNTVIKAVLFDEDGRQIAMHMRNGQSSTPAPGQVERDLNELWNNAKQVIGDCIASSGIDPRQIAAIGCAGHGNGLYLVDREGEPLTGIQSLDTRAKDQATELQDNGDRLHEICLQKPWPAQTPTLLAWIKRHRPDVYARTGTVMLCKDFITLRLTGERVSDISDMSGCGLVRMPECTYDSELLTLYGLDDAADKLPRLVDSCEIAGVVSDVAARQTGLAPGTPVIGGYFDVVSSALGSGAVNAGDVSVIVGTWGINQVISDRPVNDPSVFMAACFGQNRFMNIESSATSAANLEWYVQNFVERGAHHDDPFSHCNQKIGEVTPAKDDPLFHPYLYGSGEGAEFRAGFYGLTGWHSEGHLLRALFEGVMFEHRRHIDVLKTAGLSIDRVFLSGGGVRSPHWPQIFADGIGVPMTVAEAQETGALGAAIGAAIAAGLVSSYEEGVEKMTRSKTRLLPNPDLGTHYSTRYKTSRDLKALLRNYWRETSEY